MTERAVVGAVCSRDIVKRGGRERGPGEAGYVEDCRWVYVHDFGFKGGSGEGGVRGSGSEGDRGCEKEEGEEERDKVVVGHGDGQF